MSHNNDESPNFSINSTQNNTTSENNFQVPNLINPITSSEPGFLINSADANILNNLLGVNNMFPIPSMTNVNTSGPVTYTTNTTTNENGISSLITISGNIFDDLSGIEEDSDDDDSIPELEDEDETILFLHTSNSTEIRKSTIRLKQIHHQVKQIHSPINYDRMESLEHLIRRLS